MGQSDGESDGNIDGDVEGVGGETIKIGHLKII